MAKKRFNEKIIKKHLLTQLEQAGDEVREKLIEWLWEDHGVRVSGNWSSIEKKILKDDSISSRELAVFMLGEGLKINEELWFTDFYSMEKSKDRKET